MNILVVEDELDIAELIQRALEEMGNRCLVARDAEHADRLLGEHDVDAVTLDLGMPGISGLDWLESIAVVDPRLARRTLVITGLEVESDTVERLARCGSGLLAKPFSLDALQGAVRSQLCRSIVRD